MEQNSVAENTSVENTVVNNTVENTVVEDTSINEKLDLIHQDLGFIACFVIFFVLVILLKYAYKFFDMIFQF